MNVESMRARLVDRWEASANAVDVVSLSGVRHAREGANWNRRVCG